MLALQNDFKNIVGVSSWMWLIIVLQVCACGTFARTRPSWRTAAHADPRGRVPVWQVSRHPRRHRRHHLPERHEASRCALSLACAPPPSRIGAHRRVCSQASTESDTRESVTALAGVRLQMTHAITSALMRVYDEENDGVVAQADLDRLQKAGSTPQELAGLAGIESRFWFNRPDALVSAIRFVLFASSTVMAEVRHRPVDRACCAADRGALWAPLGGSKRASAAASVHRSDQTAPLAPLPRGGCVRARVVGRSSSTLGKRAARLASLTRGRATAGTRRRSSSVRLRWGATGMAVGLSLCIGRTVLARTCFLRQHVRRLTLEAHMLSGAE